MALGLVKNMTQRSDYYKSGFMNLLEKNSLNKIERKEVFHLWNSQYPINLNYSTLSHFENYLEILQSEFHLLVMVDNQIKGWYFDFLREDERWFGLLLASDLQGRGIGTDILSRAKTQRRKLCGWIIPVDNYLRADGQPYKSPQDFYLKNGFDILSNIRLETENISAVKIEWKALQ